MSSNKIETRIKILEATWHLLEKQPKKELKMSDVANAAGVSRQALYLHFDSKTSLMIATVEYVDEVKGLEERLKVFESAKTGTELLESCVTVWGNYIPEIYNVAKALLIARETDESAAAAWGGCMLKLRTLCQLTIRTLQQEGKLRKDWTSDEALEILWAQISISHWEQLVIESRFSPRQFVESVIKILKMILIHP